jgi:hypothetical protein
MAVHLRFEELAGNIEDCVVCWYRDCLGLLHEFLSLRSLFMPLFLNDNIHIVKAALPVQCRKYIWGCTGLLIVILCRMLAG